MPGITNRLPIGSLVPWFPGSHLQFTCSLRPSEGKIMDPKLHSISFKLTGEGWGSGGWRIFNVGLKDSATWIYANPG